ncbi:MAG: portal protein [Planctomycetaceae bacterium]|nr:portal protein [Planctomycetaceae bacterium]
MTPERQPGPVQSRYQRLSVSRQPFLDEARECAKLTIPSLCPPAGLSNGAKLAEPYQSLGAHGVKNLAEKILMSLFPPGRPFFRLSISQFDMDRQVAEMSAVMAQQQNVDPEVGQQFVNKLRRMVTSEVEKNLANVERAIIRDFEIEDIWSTDSEVVKHLINDGSVMRYCSQSSDERPRLYDLDHHVVKRDPDGTVLEMITREGVTAVTLEPDICEACGIEMDDDQDVGEHEYDLFTHIHREGNRWMVVQELNGVTVPGSEGSYPIDACPWMPLRWTKIDGEDYGRSHVSDYRGSLRSLEGLTKAPVENAAAAARTLGFVNPNSQYGTRLKDIAGAENGAILTGNANDVTFLQVGKYHDLQVPLRQVQMLYQELGQAFLLNSSVQRDAERVTAREISLLAQELEIALGGVYSTLGKEYQLPILQNLMAKIKKAGSLPPLPAEVKPTIITGMDMLGRNADLEKLAQYGQFLQMFPPDIVRSYLRFSDIFKQGAVAIGIDTESILKSEEEVEQERQQEMQMALAQQAIGPAINAGAQTAAQPQRPV